MEGLRLMVWVSALKLLKPCNDSCPVEPMEGLGLAAQTTSSVVWCGGRPGLGVFLQA